MVQPGRVGEVVADLRFSTDKGAADVKKDLEEVAATTDAEMSKIGKEAGESFDEEIKKSTKNTGRDLAKGIQGGLEREGLKLTKQVLQLDPDGNVVRTWLTTELIRGERAVADLAGSGAFKKIGSAFSDAIGASFNISGKSPLVPLLATLFGFIAQLVVGAIQLLNGLTAVLATVPSAIGAIILQVGVLFLAFQGVGGAIQQAFAATNADELKKALEGVTPAAQDFVKTLLGLREPFKLLRDVAQEAFFDRIGASIQRVADVLGPILLKDLAGLAGALGDVARGILNVLANPVFSSFLSELIPATIDWLHGFNSAFQDFLIGVADLGRAVMPFFTWLGAELNQALANFGTWLGNLSVDPEFTAWLERMKVALTEGGEALMSILGFLKEFVNAIDKAGGSEGLNDLRTWFDEMKKFLATDEGIKAMEGLLHVIQALAFVFVLLVNSIIAFLFIVEVTAEFIKNGLLPAIADFFTNKIPEFFDFVGGKILAFKDWLIAGFKEGFDATLANMGAFLDSIGTALANAAIAILQFLGQVGASIIEFLFTVAGAVVTWFHDRIMDVIDFAKSIGGNISDAVGNLGNLLYDAGRNLIQGLINGIKSMFRPLANVIDEGVQIVRDRWPFSPAKEGPLSGDGDPMIAGKNIIQRLAEGMEIAAPDLATASNNATSNVSMGSGAVQMNFYGAPPTQQQAAGIGAAAGGSLADTLAQRNTRLAVRSIGIAAAAN